LWTVFPAGCATLPTRPRPQNSHTHCKSFHLTSTPSSIYPLTGSSLAITYHFWHIFVALPSLLLLLRLPACFACPSLETPACSVRSSCLLNTLVHCWLLCWLLADCCLLLSESELRQSRLNLSTVTFSPFSPFHTSPPLTAPPPPLDDDAVALLCSLILPVPSTTHQNQQPICWLFFPHLQPRRKAPVAFPVFFFFTPDFPYNNNYFFLFALTISWSLRSVSGSRLSILFVPTLLVRTLPSRLFKYS